MYIDKNILHTERIFPIQGRQEYLRLDMNENPEGLPEDFVTNTLLKINSGFISTYPEPQKFIDQYAKFINFNSDNITVSNGSDQAIRYILQTFGDKEQHGEVLTVSPTFEMYKVNCELLGLTHVKAEYKNDFTIDIDDILNKINEKTNIVVLLNPNNPIGNIYTEEEINKIIEKAQSENALVVIDEAYHYFCPNTYIDKVNQYDNVIVLRTFSKLCSMASLRLGVIISNPKIITLINKIKLTFDVNSFALLFGYELITQPNLMKDLIDIEKEGRLFLIRELEKLNYDLYYAESNFICFKPKHTKVYELSKRFYDNKVLVKTYSNSFLKDYIRICTGSKKIMNYFLKLLKELDV